MVVTAVQALLVSDYLPHTPFNYPDSFLVRNFVGCFSFVILFILSLHLQIFFKTSQT